ncbi:[histone H3]-dimethyl-L-lysine(36) demethylase [Malassezia cuniculi]|uniref:[histone H3]-dimethyl-L-lysine(36) demethylase n=1 Tax=Malassezia cuniculi TaxID=948313 RepID=A0AAF0J7A0_9BASI|nr:[histone H3]-dimethyl-L-lysine(36) demethylase [Malassezia cuniculi]
MPARHFVDHVVMLVEGGCGGDGCVSFHREKFVAFGPPAGGNGGAGGSVYIRADPTLHSLARTTRRAVAKDGLPGQGAWLHGKSGQDVTIHVPVGTTVRALGRVTSTREAACSDYFSYLFSKRHKRSTEIDPEEEPELSASRSAVWRHFPRFEDDNYERSHFFAAEEKLKSELRAQRRIAKSMPHAERSAASLTQRIDDVTRASEHWQQDAGWSVDLARATPPDSPGILLASGGNGGLGNPHFALEKYRSPKVALRGGAGESLLVSLEYKQPSDIGLVGLPNAGKSTLLRCLSRADAQVGSWSFTTLRPNLGVLRMNDDGQLTDRDAPETSRLILADMPGLIADASQNKGLGHDFLRHIERCGMLVYVVDLSGPPGSPTEAILTLNRELDAYRPGLTDRVGLVVANKADLLGAEGPEAAADAQAMLARLRSDVDMLFGYGRVPVVPVSAKHKQNVHTVAAHLQRLVRTADE